MLSEVETLTSLRADLFLHSFERILAFFDYFKSFSFLKQGNVDFDVMFSSVFVLKEKSFDITF
jgi:hypothetical protein